MKLLLRVVVELHAKRDLLRPGPGQHKVKMLGDQARDPASLRGIYCDDVGQAHLGPDGEEVDNGLLEYCVKTRFGL